MVMMNSNQFLQLKNQALLRQWVDHQKYMVRKDLGRQLLTLRRANHLVNEMALGLPKPAGRRAYRVEEGPPLAKLGRLEGPRRMQVIRVQFQIILISEVRSITQAKDMSRRQIR